MADFYSNLYKGPAGATVGNPNSPVGPFAYQGPAVLAPGATATVYGTFTNVAANAFGGTAGDVLHLCGVPEQSKLVDFVIVPSADLDTPNTFTFNLGYTSALTAFASANTGLQTAAAFTIAAAVLLPIAPAIFGTPQELLLSRVAGSLNVAGTLYFMAEFAAGNTPTN